MPGCAWAECDRNRPLPAKVDASEERVPSDALVLIGKGPASLGNLRRGMSADPVGWKFVSEDVIEVVPGTQSAVTKEKFADFQLHVEWQVPDDARLLDRWGGNSGIIPITGRRYEVQILDSRYSKNGARLRLTPPSCAIFEIF